MLELGSTLWFLSYERSLRMEDFLLIAPHFATQGKGHEGYVKHCRFSYHFHGNSFVVLQWPVYCSFSPLSLESAQRYSGPYIVVNMMSLWGKWWPIASSLAILLMSPDGLLYLSKKLSHIPVKIKDQEKVLYNEVKRFDHNYRMGILAQHSNFRWGHEGNCDFSNMVSGRGSYVSSVFLFFFLWLHVV